MIMSNSNYETYDMGNGLWRIVDSMVQMYLIEGEKRSILVDAGVSGGDLLSVVKDLTKKPVTLVLTHADRDHVASAPYFDEVWLHPAEYERFLSQNIKPVPMKPLWDSDVLDLGGRSLTVTHIPGHTPGSIVLLDKDARFLMVGDSISDYAVWMFGVGRCIPAYICSLEKLIAMTNQFDTIHSAHGTPILSPEIIPETLEAIHLLADGKLEGQTVDENASHKFYKAKTTGFMY